MYRQLGVLCVAPPLARADMVTNAVYFFFVTVLEPSKVILDAGIDSIFF